MHSYKVEIELRGDYEPVGQHVHNVDEKYCILLFVHRGTNLIHGLGTECEKVEPLLKNMREMFKLPQLVMSRAMFERDDGEWPTLSMTATTTCNTSDLEVFVAVPVVCGDGISNIVGDDDYRFYDAHIHGETPLDDVPILLEG